MAASSQQKTTPALTLVEEHYIRMAFNEGGRGGGLFGVLFLRPWEGERT